MKDKMFKRIISATLSIVMALSMYTCRAVKSSSEQVVGSNAIQRDEADEQRRRDEQAAADAKRVKDEQAAADATATVVPVPKPVAPVPAAEAQRTRDEQVAAAAVPAPLPVAILGHEILKKYGYDEKRSCARGWIVHPYKYWIEPPSGKYRGAINFSQTYDGDKSPDLDPEYPKPIVLEDAEFAQVIHSMRGTLVYKGVCDTSDKKTHISRELLMQDLFNAGALSSTRGNWLRIEGNGVFFTTDAHHAIYFASGASSKEYRWGSVIMAFLIDDSKPFDPYFQSDGDTRVVRSNSKFVIRRSTFDIDDHSSAFIGSTGTFAGILNDLYTQKFKQWEMQVGAKPFK